jgi:hypothetical protein
MSGILVDSVGFAEAWALVWATAETRAAESIQIATERTRKYPIETPPKRMIAAKPRFKATINNTNAKHAYGRSVAWHRAASSDIIIGRSAT